MCPDQVGATILRESALIRRRGNGVPSTQTQEIAAIYAGSTGFHKRGLDISRGGDGSRAAKTHAA
jgi:hypothetical protein